jgi:glycosyltransferase involved in cell wall biosynthesis
MTMSSLRSAAEPVPRACDLLVVQPALPHYRRPFFELLGRHVSSLTVLHGAEPLAGAETETTGAIPGVRTLAVAHRRIGPALWMPAMWHAAGDLRFDVAVLGWNTRYPQLPAAMLRARRAGIGVVLWGHGYSIAERPARRRYRNFLIRYADAVITYNQRAARDLAADGLASTPVFVAPNALGVAAIEAAVREWTIAPQRLRRFRDELGLHDDPIALHVSRLGNAGNLEVLLETWRAVVAAVPRAQLVIVGDGPARGAVASVIARAGLGRSVRCVGAVFGEHAIAPYFLSARLVLHPVKVGLSLNHAMAYGVPVVTFDDAARHSPEFEALEHQANGLVARHGDVRALAAEAARLLVDDGLAARLGRGAIETMRTRYSLDAMVAGFLAAVDAARWRQ